MCYVFRGQLSSKKDLQAKIGAQWENFQENQHKISNSLLATQGKVQEIVFNADSYQKLPSAIKELDIIWEAHNATRMAKDGLTSQGQALMAEDENNVGTIQNILTSIDANWDKVNQMIKSNRDKLSAVLVSTQKFNQAKDKLYKAIEAPKQKPKQEDEGVNDLMQATIAFEKNKKVLETLKKAKTSLDQMDAKAQEIAKQAENLDGFDLSNIKQQLASAKQDWQKAMDDLNQQFQASESEMVIWKQIDEAKNDLLQWLGETNAALSDAAENVTDSEVGQTHLAAYKNDLESKQTLRASVKAKTAQLVQIHNGKQIPTLLSLEKLLDEEFDEVAKLAKKLGDITSTFGQSEKSIKENIKAAGDKVGRIREKLIKCDNLTGENSKILERLKTCQGLKADLNNLSSDMDGINTSVEDIKSKFPSFSDSHIVKELNGLNKRYSDVMSHNQKVEKTLLMFLVKYHKEKLSALQRIIVTFKEKILWCRPEPGSDKYNLESKVTSLHDLESGLTECENKKMELDGSFEILLKVEGDINTDELKDERDQLEKDVAALKASFSKTKKDLDNGLVLWKKYEQHSDGFGTWLKDIESQVRAQGSALIELSTVPKKVEEMIKFKANIEGMEPELKEIESLGEEMMKQCSELRVGHQVSQLASRYLAVTKFVDGNIERLQTLNQNHGMYNNAVKKAETWLDEANLKLSSFDEAVKSGSKPSLYQEKLNELKSFMEQRETGQVLLNKAVEQGEALFPEITPSDRDTVRAQLRGLRDASEALIDKANAITKRVEGMLMQRSSFDDSYSQVSKWVSEIDKKIGDKNELKSTLPDKKVALHGYRNLAQDINSHQTIFKQLQDKIAVLSDSEASGKFDDIMENYKKVSKKVEDKVAVAEKHVVDHEGFVQSLEKFKDFMNILAGEEAKSDKDGAEVQLATLEDVLLQKEDGDKLLNACDDRLKIVVQQTAKPGHAPLLAELGEQKKNWTAFIKRCNDNVTKLRQLCSRWTQFEEKLEEINSWIKQKESQVKDQSLKNTQEAKQQHLDKLKSLEEEIVKKADEVGALHTGITEAGPELVEKVSKTSTRYQALRNQTKVKKLPCKV